MKVIGKFLIISFSIIIFDSASSEIQFTYDYSLMEDDWSFLPDPPESFKSTKSAKYSIGYVGEKYGVIIGKSDLELELLRSTEPKDVSLDVTTDEIDLYYYLNENSYLQLGFSNQKPVDQIFNCYGFGSLTIGSCEDSDIEISSTNPIYQDLNGALISLSAETKSYSFSYIKELSGVFLQEASLGITSTEHIYDWKTPIEDISSPFLLGLSFEGETLGDLIDQTLNRLPQRDPWKLYQVNFGFKGDLIQRDRVSFFYEASFRLFKFDDYEKVKETPSFNTKLRLGLRTIINKISIEFYGDIYQHNLIGFQPITFNQRTEHQFDRKYGELGMNIAYRF